ncbi:putative 85/88 kDa calcium-independent phospholipase A2 [Apostichopus japonicus]|uniref:Putative 85/88 kDa calcium-independent phospholipase A2 n=3 Tax=Stichopus japonicus TaxID=307972 RepID=A0A2G8KHH2_STIJA|nr:putative 85/88 kDa calcium-independent phospholipase A2 [Apostichopus japonicus]
MIEQVCDTRGRSVDRSRAWCHSIGAAFYRFSPPLSVETSLDETRDSALMKMLFETQVYIVQNQEKIQQLAQILKSI